jgi:sodium/proline symporter
MSVFKDKKIIGIYNKDLSGINVAGNISVTEIFLWVILLLPAEIAVRGAGVCFTDIGLFAGISYVWIFLVKRLRSYADISECNMRNMQDFLYARYSSPCLKIIISALWFVLLGAMAGGAIMFMVDVIKHFLDINGTLLAAAIIFVICLIRCVAGKKTMCVIKSIVYAMTLLSCLALIIVPFIYNKPSELLDIYRQARLAGGTSIYLNIMYLDGMPIGTLKLINIFSVGLGCMGLPVLFEGAFETKNLRELDRGRIMAIVYAGVIVISFSVWSLLVVACVYPHSISVTDSTYELINMYVTSLFEGVTYGEIISSIIVVIWGGAVICLTGTLFHFLEDTVIACISDDKISESYSLKLLIDIFVMVCVAAITLVFSIQCKWNFYSVIKTAWKFSSAVAAPVILSILWQRMSKAGIISGVLTSVLAVAVWMWLPVKGGISLVELTGVDAGLAAFAVSMVVSIFVSIIFKNHNEEEMKVFQKMVQEQR